MAWQSDKLKEAHKELVDKVIKDMEEGKVFFLGQPAFWAASQEYPVQEGKWQRNQRLPREE